ncbi:hypothetical protein [Streptomyces sp. JJ66]|nr:hypothetical protein [Streptomyces sp. JJ66]
MRTWPPQSIVADEEVELVYEGLGEFRLLARVDAGLGLPADT